LAFTNAGSKAKTVFDRGQQPAGQKKGADSKPPYTEFRSGNVGLGVKKALKHLHIGGSHWSQGKLILKGGFIRAQSASMLEVTELVQLAEHPTRSKDVGEVIKSLAQLVRKNKARLKNQATSIALMERQLMDLRSQ